LPLPLLLLLLLGYIRASGVGVTTCRVGVTSPHSLMLLLLLVVEQYSRFRCTFN
jgi:hypothetical protein